MVLKKYFNSYDKDLFVGLIVSLVTNEKIDNLELNEEVLKEIISYAKFHSVEYLVLKSLEFNGIILNDKLKKMKTLLLHKCAAQMSELDNIKYTLNKFKINHLPLKGSIIRTFYDDEACREMADLDILVPKNEMKNMKRIMTKELGYDVGVMGGNNPHDSYMKKPFMEVEIHRKLMVDSSKVSSYLLKTWDSCKSESDGSFTYVLSNEDFYIYNIMHNVKHFSKGGTGVRIFIDLYYSFKKNKYDMNYINQELKEFGLDKYNERLISITNKLFNNSDLDNDELFLLDYIINCGTYGTVENDIVGNVLVNNQEDDNLNKNKRKYLWNRLFPPYKVMKDRNPSLIKFPILLPWFWFTRLIKGMFSFKTYSTQASRINTVNNKDLERRKKIKEITDIDPYDW